MALTQDSHVLAACRCCGVTTAELQSFNARRLAKSTDLLLGDLQRTADDLNFEKNVQIEAPELGKFLAPIYLKKTKYSSRSLSQALSKLISLEIR